MSLALLLDENFPAPSTALLRAAGLDLEAISEIAPGLDDEAVLVRAVRDGRWLVTFDRDYGDLVVDTAAAIRAMLASGKLPPPVNDARCKECSLKEICQPQALAGRERLKQLAGELFSPDGEVKF